MRGVNKAIIVGTCGGDPDARATAAGEPVTVLSLATNEQWTDKRTGEKQQRTEWHRVVVFGRPAEIAAQYLRKGSAVYVEGKLRTREWEKDGVKRYTTEIVVDGFGVLQLLGGPNDGTQPAPARSTPAQRPQAQPAQPAGGDPYDDDIPFAPLAFLAGV